MASPTSVRNDPPVIRFQYDNREDLYDAISYSKAGAILHMLRKYTGDSAFFESLKRYLNDHKFGTAEIHDLRLAFEKTTGEDLNWFFDEWFMKGGHPTISIDFDWNDSLRTEKIIVKQKQDLSKNPLYKIPLDVDFYYNGKVDRKRIIIEDAEQSFQFNLQSKPDLVNVDAEKMLVCSKSDNKTNKELIFQYNHAPLFLDRYEAISKIGETYSIKTPEADVILKAMNDKFHIIRLGVLNYIGELAKNDPDTVKIRLIELAKSDSSADVREKALTCMDKYFSYSENKDLYYALLKDSSYKVEARAFEIIAAKEISKANELALTMEKDSGKAMLLTLSEFYRISKEDKTSFYKMALRRSSLYSRYLILSDFEKYLENINDNNILNNVFYYIHLMVSSFSEWGLLFLVVPLLIRMFFLLTMFYLVIESNNRLYTFLLFQ